MEGKRYEVRRLQTCFTSRDGCVVVTVVFSAICPARASASEGSSDEKNEEGQKEKRTDVRMPFLTAAIEGGMIFFSGMSITAKNGDGEKETRSISNRIGGILKLQINLLGDGLGLEITPFFGSEWVGDPGLDRFSMIGAQIGLAYRFHIRRVYPKIGIGAHLSYLAGGDISRGMEAFGRLPIGVSIYFVRMLALEIEGALLTGTSGIETQTTDDFGRFMHFDYNTGFEVVVGLRFP